MGYTNKTYVCFDADSDIRYYNLMKAWKEHEHHDFNFNNAHDLNNLRDGSSEETIKRKLRERLANTKVLIVLIGEKTKNLHRFVRWEMEYAIENDIPIIAVNLNGKRAMDDQRCPPILRDKLVVHVSFGQKIINHALNNWTVQHYKERNNKNTGPFYYSDAAYQSLQIQ